MNLQGWDDDTVIHKIKLDVVCLNEVTLRII